MAFTSKMVLFDFGIACKKLSYSWTVSVLVPSAVTSPFSMLYYIATKHYNVAIINITGLKNHMKQTLKSEK
jgi:hypothetical protein